MSLLTLVYVIATIVICIFNYRSAKATRDQVAESQRQFEEANRAYVTVTFELIRSGLIVLHIQNHGKRIAKDVRIKVADTFVNNVQDEHFKESIDKLNHSSFTLGIGQSWYVCIGSHLNLKQIGKELLHIDIQYSDSKCEYSDRADIDLKQYYWSIIYDSPLEDLCQHTKESNEYLKTIATKLTRNS